MKKLMSNKLFFIFMLVSISLLSYTVITYCQFVASVPSSSRSGVNGTVVTVDDEKADLYYYNSLNYTETSGTLPSGADLDKYNTSNMVKVTITYYGRDFFDNSLVGKVSTTENYDTYVYYHWYPIVNGKITIPLIDNPFAKRPTGKGFNSWISNEQGVRVYLDKDTYERFAEVTVNSNADISLSFYAHWIDAKEGNSSEGWSTVFGRFDTYDLHPITTTHEVCVPPTSINEVVMNGYYLRHTAARYSYYTGYYIRNGSIREANNRYCSTNGGCTYYTIIDDGSLYNSGTTYYRINDAGNNFTTVTNAYILEHGSVCHDEDLYSSTSIMAGFYTPAGNISRYASIDGLYDDEGNIQSGTCGTYGGCNNLYKYLDKYDDNGNVNYFQSGRNYYYLATRDTNIMHLNSSNLTSSWGTGTTYNKPFTFTGILANGTQSTNRWTPSGNMTIPNDTTFEHMIINSNTSYSSADMNNSKLLIAAYHNLKIGRGLEKYSDYYGEYVNFNGLVGGAAATGNSSGDTRYKMIVESGYFNNTSVTEGTSRGSYNDNLYIQANMVYGCDLDRVRNDNSKLEVYYEATASWAGNIRSNDEEVAVWQTVKSGNFGTSKADMYTGIYVGGVLNGTYYAARGVKVEGGWIYNLIGGPLTSSNRRSVNDTYIYMTGGTVDLIVGGAGRSSSYGHRIIAVTGGTISYSILGGSNGNISNTGDGDGTLYGSSFIYVGGDAVIGDSSLSSTDDMYGVNPGNVFGNGNGKSGYLGIGSNDNSYILINEGCTIRNNVYGGGNYGMTGVSSGNSTAESKITVLNGKINGNVYGGGNQNKVQDSNVVANVIINMSGGTVSGSIFGGADYSGIVTGSTNVNVTGGVVTGGVYGGGEGSNTYVKRDSNVTIGTVNTTGPTIGNVYGGSAFGTVNNYPSSSSVSSYNTHVIVNAGTITNAFGGGQGDADNTPYVCGNVVVDVNGGKVTNVYGGNDLKGTPNGTVTVNINGGTVTNAYAGGNQTVVTEPHINIHGGTTTNAYGGGNNAQVTTSHVLVDGGTTTNLFGGSNSSGNVTTSNVVINNGTVTNAFGGNNVGGSTGTTNVTVNGGNVGTVYGGGEKTSVTSSTNVNINSAVTNVFGGSDSNGTVQLSNVNMNVGSTSTNVYGGNNLGGNTVTSNVNILGGVIDSAYGGGLQATTGTTNVNLNYGYSNNIYGGGNKAGATVTHVNLNKGYSNNVFGGSNNSGTVTDSYVSNSSSTIANNNISAIVTKSVSNINQTNNQDKVSSENLSVSITNNTGHNLVTWDAYLFVSDSVFDSNWSGTTVEVNGKLIHANHVNQWYGTNPINSGSTHTFDFNIHSSVSYDDYKIYGYMVVGYDSNGNRYQVEKSYNEDLYADKVFGGNNQGGVTTNSHVNLTTGVYGSIYGGGEKAATNVTTVVVDGVTVNDVVYGGGDQAQVNTNTSVEIKDNANILGDVFGGGNAGAVNGNAVVSINNSNVSDNVYGGGNQANVTGNTTVSITNSATITKSVFGGGNVGAVGGNAVVTVNNSSVSDDLYGGGNQADVTGTTTVTITNGSTLNKNVFGGGNAGRVLDDASVTISGSNVTKTVYGGGNQAAVNGDTTVLINNSATITENVYGGGNAGQVLGNTDLDINNATVNNNVFGGGNQAAVIGNTDVDFNNATIGNSIYGGGNQAEVRGDTSVMLLSSTVTNNIFGGGNNGSVYGDASTDIKNSSVGDSAHAGGNGATAIVYGNNEIDVEGTTSITNHLFGGGNAAATGCATDVTIGGNLVCTANTSTSHVNVSGATIGGNVYGGANTSVVYGETYVNIGKDTVPSTLTKGDIHITGTVFGGGEANAAGSEDYDFNFISVTRGININIDANSHNTFLIDGSIFGSGNASSSGGYSYVNIHNYGTNSLPKENISIQRADIVVLDNSSVALKGAQDRTNKYKSELFTFSRIGHLKLKNGSSIYLERGANLLENFSSLVDINNQEVLAEVTINKNSGTVTKNVDNRVYMMEGKNLNISDDESLATYGNVNGMSFFGMFKRDRNGNVTTGRYNEQYDYGDSISGSEQYLFNSGSYVVGKHKSAHDIEVDGFYSNFPTDDGSEIVVDYIEPTPADATYYRWVIGETVEVLELSLTASKYSTLGTYELQLRDFYHPNTEVHVLGVNFNDLSSSINLLDDDDIPRIAATEADANSNFGLAMKSGNVGWITRGTTEFATVGMDMQGTTTYKAENTNAIPSFVFYLYHSKNITEQKNLGTVVISLMIVTPIDDLSNKIQRINVEVSLATALYDGDNYEGSIAPGYQYKLFANSPVNITSKSAFSTYFSLFSTTPNLYRAGSYRCLVSSYALPVNTKITMIDFASSSNPEYYYYIVDNATYNASVIDVQRNGETSYRLSNFIRMGSSSSGNTYNDSVASSHYYNSSNHNSGEEFIFIVDMKDTSINSNVIHKSMLLELRDTNDNPIIPVLDVSQQRMFYNMYVNKDSIINATANLSNNSLYVGQSVDLTVVTDFTQQTYDNTSIIDTTFYDKRLGIKLSLYTSDDTLVNGATLLGTAFVYDGVRYYPRQDGTVRFNVAESIANVSSKIKIDATNSSISTGDYKLVIETFGSSDGIYYGLEASQRITKNIKIINEVFGLKATLPDEDVIIDKDTGMGEDKNKYLDFQMQYASGLTHPSVRVSMYRRTYTDIYNYTYELVDFQDYVSDELVTTNEQKVYMVKNLPTNRFQYIVNLKEHLRTGTYQIRFSLYDDNNYVGHINKYIIIE